jgi:cytoskeleton protein RodZ
MSDPGTRTGSAPGALLAAARKAQNLSLADAARQLRLSAAQVDALETGAFDRLPGPVFVRGFIRNYARLLKLDPDAVIGTMEPDIPQQAQHLRTPPSTDIPMPVEQRRQWSHYAILVLLLVIGLAVYEFHPELFGGEDLKPAPVAAMPSSAQTESVPRPDEIAAAADAGRRAESLESAQPVAALPETATQPAAVAAPAVAAQAPRNAAPAARERRVQMVFEQSSWVEIRDASGKAIFSQLNPPGTEQRVSGVPPLSFVVGNARGVRLSYDEQPVDLARHTTLDVARFRLE